MEFRVQFSHVTNRMCFGDPKEPHSECKFFSKLYGDGQGKGAACMHPKSIEKFAQEKKRGCPLVLMEPDNRLAADFLWLTMAERFNPFLEGYRDMVAKTLDPLHTLRSYRRAIATMSSEPALEAMGVGSKGAKTTATNQQRTLKPKPQARGGGARPGGRRR